MSGGRGRRWCSCTDTASRAATCFRWRGSSPPAARHSRPTFRVTDKASSRRTPLGIGGLADALGGWLDAVGLERPAFVANSMGCQIVTELAVRRPQRVGPMVLVGPTIDPGRRSARHQIFGAMRDSAHEPALLVALAGREWAAQPRPAPSPRALGARRPDRGAAAGDRATHDRRPRRKGRPRQPRMGRAGCRTATARPPRHRPRRAARDPLHPTPPRSPESSRS